jgi:hypothetical protein
MEILSLVLEDGTKDRLKEKFVFMSKPFQELVEPVLDGRILLLTDKKLLKRISRLAKKQDRTVGAQATVMLMEAFKTWKT